MGDVDGPGPPPDGPSLLALPDDILIVILSNLRGRDLAALSLTCKVWTTRTTTAGLSIASAGAKAALDAGSAEFPLAQSAGEEGRPWVRRLHDWEQQRVAWQARRAEAEASAALPLPTGAAACRAGKLRQGLAGWDLPGPFV